jgi:CheY-like chemotaxis protein
MTSILVVDDTAVDRCLVLGLLRRNAALDVEAVEDAESALAWLESRVPDVVVTDLQLPEMSGLDLVVVLRERFPGLPVIVITAHGNEETAVRALADGAASYVPKTQMSDRLMATIEQVLEGARVDQAGQDFQTCLEEARLRFQVPVHADVFGYLTEMACGMASSVGLCDRHDQMRFAMAMQGLLRIGHFAGNLEMPLERLEELDSPRSPAFLEGARRSGDMPFATRRLAVEIDMSLQRGVFRVRHEGRPFATDFLAAHGAGAANPKSVCRDLVLLQAFADRLWLEDDGQTLAMSRMNPSFQPLAD